MKAFPLLGVCISLKISMKLGKNASLVLYACWHFYFHQNILYHDSWRSFSLWMDQNLCVAPNSKLFSYVTWQQWRLWRRSGQLKQHSAFCSVNLMYVRTNGRPHCKNPMNLNNSRRASSSGTSRWRPSTTCNPKPLQCQVYLYQNIK